MHITLAALDPGLHAAWQRAFVDVPDVECVIGNILDRRADAIVSPANSFGFMDGGLDLVYSQFFGWNVEARVRRELLKHHDGELAVGQAVIVETDHERFPWLISAPTMRVPMNVAETTNAMLAFRAVLRAARLHNQVDPDRPIRSIVCPGLGTGEGRMPASRCARQMRYAWDVVADGRVELRGGLAGAVRNHMFLLEQEPP